MRRFADIRTVSYNSEDLMKLSSSFIYASPEFTEFSRFVPSPYFRKTLSFETIPEKCEITVCGMGFYRLWINGKEITKGLLAPYISNPDHMVYFDNYNLAGYLENGENVFGFQLGNGMMNAPGGTIWDFHKASFRGAPRLAFCIEWSENGVDFSAEADESVKCAASPTYFDDLRCGVRYDARNEINGWNLPGFDADGWQNAVLCDAPKGEKRLCDADPVLPTGEEIKPVLIRKAELGDYIPNEAVVGIVTQELPDERKGYLYDFGVNKAGICRLKINGRPGQRIELQFAEHVDDDGRVFYGNIDFYPDGYSQRDVYICKGEGTEIFEPPFTYHGFRYCLVIGIDDAQATEDLLTYVVANSAIEERGGFFCSDETANTLQKMCRISDLANFYYFPTDCPHREKNGWTGDIAASAEHIMMNLKAEKSFRVWLDNVRKAQRDDGSIPPVVPCDKWGGECGPAWDCVIAFLPYYMYVFTGDTDVPVENAEAIFRYLHFLENSVNEKGLIDFGLGDWCAVRNNCKATREYTSSVMSLAAADKASFIFNILGKAEHKKYADSLSASFRTAIRKYYVDADKVRIDTNCQTSLAMAFYYGLLDESEKDAFAAKLVELIHENDDHIDFGLLGARTLFHVLSDIGETELAYGMICRPDWPSYGNFIERGFTSMPEDFQMEGKRIDSLNHHFMCDISNWFISRVAGLRYNPTAKNHSDLLLEPFFVEKLGNAEAFFDSPSGKITVSWKKASGEAIVRADFPAGIICRFSIPAGWELLSAERTETSFKAALKKS